MTPRELEAFTYWQVSKAYRRHGYDGEAGYKAVRRLVFTGRSGVLRSRARVLYGELCEVPGEPPTEGGAA